MPSKKKKYNARFPPARIKKIMQSDEEVGKVAQAVPVIISRALELFVESLLKKAECVTQSRNAKTLTPSHLKQCILGEQRFDFLKDLVATIPDVQGDEEMAETPRSSTSNHPFTFPPASASASSASASASIASPSNISLGPSSSLPSYVQNLQGEISGRAQEADSAASILQGSSYPYDLSYQGHHAQQQYVPSSSNPPGALSSPYIPMSYLPPSVTGGMPMPYDYSTNSSYASGGTQSSYSGSSNQTSISSSPIPSKNFYTENYGQGS